MTNFQTAFFYLLLRSFLHRRFSSSVKEFSWHFDPEFPDVTVISTGFSLPYFALSENPCDVLLGGPAPIKSSRSAKLSLDGIFLFMFSSRPNAEDIAFGLFFRLL